MNLEPWQEEAVQQVANFPDKIKEVRASALESFEFFCKLVNKGYVYGSIHEETMLWMQDYTLFGQGTAQTANKMIMFPRAHLKSHLVASWCAWIITRHPEVTILYLSATAELAETQLFAVQNILGSDIYRRYFPEYVNPQEGKRERWSSRKLSIDHPKRSREGIRDATVATAGLTTNTTGWHADIVISDDVVVPENAYTEDGRDGVSKKTSQFTSIRNAGGFTMACGTRYHPNDIYATWKTMEYEDWDDEGNSLGMFPVWDIKEHVVEQDGVYLWPRRMRKDGKAFGFDQRTLARIKAEYTDATQFFAQYYNNPNESSSNRLDRSVFQYYNQRLLKKQGARWYYNGKRLNIYAAVDFAFSLSKRADYTAIVVIGIDCDGNIYILDIDRFKSDKTKEYFDHIRDLHAKWTFNKLRAEVTVAQKVIVNEVKRYIKKYGLSLPVEEYRPTRSEGSKEERIAAALEHKYDDQMMWHSEGGWTDLLEDELVSARPAHDDMKDALASAVSIAVPPKRSGMDGMNDFFKKTGTHSRFGGVR